MPHVGEGFHPSSSHPAPHSVAVTRSKDVPPFGPPIPSGVTFRKSDVFRDFLLAKTINAENAAHKSAKFRAMATRTRREYLKDLAENFVTNTPIDSSGKFNLISLTSKKKEKTKARVGAELHSAGAIAWRVSAQDFARGVEIPSILGISNEFVVLLDLGAKEVVFNCFCGDVIGWTADGANLKVFYGRGDHICVRAAEGGAEDVKEIVQRLKVGGGVGGWGLRGSFGWGVAVGEGWRADSAAEMAWRVLVGHWLSGWPMVGQWLSGWPMVGHGLANA